MLVANFMSYMPFEWTIYSKFYVTFPLKFTTSWTFHVIDAIWINY